MEEGKKKLKPTRHHQTYPSIPLRYAAVKILRLILIKQKKFTSMFSIQIIMLGATKIHVAWFQLIYLLHGERYRPIVLSYSYSPFTIAFFIRLLCNDFMNYILS